MLCYKCKHFKKPAYIEPCNTCTDNGIYSKYEPINQKESIEMIKECRNCKHSGLLLMEDPCYNCIDDDDKPAFEPTNRKESIEMTTEQKQPTYTDAVYELIKDECKDLDAIYEDYIISLVGDCGLGALKRAGLLEGCGVLNCRQLYTLVERIDIPEDQIIIDRDIKDEKGTYTGGKHERNII